MMTLDAHIYYNSQDPLHLVSSHFPPLPPSTTALSFSAIVLSAKVFVPSTNIWTIESSKNRLKKSRGVEVVVNVILGPGCWTNGSGVGGVSIDVIDGRPGVVYVLGVPLMAYNSISPSTTPTTC